METCENCRKVTSGNTYTLGLMFLADDDEKATTEYDREPIFCDAKCANKWLSSNFNGFMNAIRK